MDYMCDIKPVLKMKIKKALGGVFDYSNDIGQRFLVPISGYSCVWSAEAKGSPGGVLPGQWVAGTCVER